MNSEKKVVPNSEEEQDPIIVIRKIIDAPIVGDNLIFDPEIWGRSNVGGDLNGEIYLPDSDEAISFAMAAHEIGHLIEEGRRLNDLRLDNFEAHHAEEQRAWDRGWGYLQKYLLEYFQTNPEIIPKIEQAFKRIKILSMQAVDLLKEMYLEPGALDDLNKEEKEEVVKRARIKFFSERSEQFKQLFRKIKEEKIGVKPDWDKFVAVVNKAIQDILRDNKKVK